MNVRRWQYLNYLKRSPLSFDWLEFTEAPGPCDPGSMWSDQEPADAGAESWRGKAAVFCPRPIDGFLEVK